MIEINLLPGRLGKKRRSSHLEGFQIPKEIIIGLIGGLVCLLVIIHLIFLLFIAGAKMNLSRLEKQWRDLEPAKQKVDIVKDEINSIESNAKNIISLKANKRTLWARKLNLISDNMVRGVWLTRIYFGQGVLKIEGSAVSKRGEEMISVGKLVSNLKKDKDFYPDIKNLELTSLQRRNIKSVEVVDFLITMGVKE